MRIPRYAGLCMACTLTLLFFAGCSSGSRQKMEVPNIKMITKDNVHGVIAPDDNNIWLTGNYGTIYHSSNEGQTWGKQESGIHDETIIVDGSFLDTKTGWLVGINGTVLHTTDAGATWVRQNTGTDKHLFGISFVDKNNGWAVGNWNTIIRTTDGGATWAQQTKEEDKIYKNVCFVDTSSGWVVGEKGYILHTTDGGQTWSQQMPAEWAAIAEDNFENPRPGLYCVYFFDKDTGWASGIDGTLIRTTDAGETWEILPTGTTLSLYTVFVKYGKGWIVGDKGAYLMSEDGGTTWKLLDDVIKSKTPLRDVFFSSPDKGWAVGVSGTVVHTTDGGKTWEFYSGLSYAMKFFEMPKALEFKGMVTE